MRRREFITLLGGGTILASPLAARAQKPDKVWRIGLLAPPRPGPDDPLASPAVIEFLKALERLSWVQGRNLRLDWRWDRGDADQVQSFAKELVGLAPDVIWVLGTPDLAAMLRETRTTPIVFVGVTDPVGQGFIASLGHPGGNVTGLSGADSTMGSKYPELLKEIAPGVTRVAFIFNPKTSPFSASVLRSVETAAPTFALRVAAAPVHDDGEIENVITAFAREPEGGLIVAPDAFNFLHRELIVAQAAQHRLPAVYAIARSAASGGLLEYGEDTIDLWRRSAVYIDRILKGAKPAELPVEQPIKFKLTINLKTAKALGLTAPQSLLARADEVIE